MSDFKKRFGEFERDGYRPMTEAEGRFLSWGQLVPCLDSATGEVTAGTVVGHSDLEVDVRFRSRAVIQFPLKAGVPPMTEVDERVLVLVTPMPWPEDKLEADLFDALRASVAINEVRMHNDRIANFVQGLPTIEMYDALHAEVRRLHAEVRRLSEEVAAMRSTSPAKVA